MTERTHCRNGHELTPEIRRVRSDGFLRCLICRRATEEGYRARRAEMRRLNPTVRIYPPNGSRLSLTEANRQHVNALRRLFGLEELA